MATMDPTEQLVNKMNKEIKEVLSKLVVDLDRRGNEIFELIQKDPSSIESDRILVHLLDLLSSTIEKYQEL